MLATPAWPGENIFVPEFRHTSQLGAINSPAERGVAKTSRNWIQRSTGDSVVLALKLDGTDKAFPQVKGTWGRDEIGFLGGSSGNPYFDSGMLRFDVPGKSGGNAAGMVYINFPANFVPSQEFYVQWRYLMNDAMFNGDFRQAISGAPPTGKKIAILGPRRSASSGPGKLVMQTFNSNPFPILYRYWNGNTDNLFTGASDGDYNLQPNAPRPHCSYARTLKARPTDIPEGCVGFAPNKLMTIDWHIKLGTKNDGAGAWESDVESWITIPGQPKRQWAFGKHMLQLQAGFGQIWFGPYMTEKDSRQDHALAFVAYSELIVSRKPIDAPMD